MWESTCRLNTELGMSKFIWNIKIESLPLLKYLQMGGKNTGLQQTEYVMESGKKF